MKTYELYSGKRAVNGNRRDRSAEDLERDLGQIRREMSDTLHQIESRVTNGDVLGQVISRLRSGDTSELMHTVGDIARANPIPLALIATGLGAMAFAGREGTTEVGRRAAHRAGERMEEMRARREERASHWRESLEHEGAEGGRRMDAAAERAREKAHRARERASERAMQLRERGERRLERERERAREGAQVVKRNGQRLIEEEPLLVAGLGVALGAFLAGAVPLVKERRDRHQRLSSSEAEPQFEIVEDVYLEVQPGPTGLDDLR